MFGSPSFCTVSFEMKHPVALLFINAFALTILPFCFQIEIGRQTELALDLKINTGAIMKEEDGVDPSSPFKKTCDNQGGKHGA